MPRWAEPFGRPLLAVADPREARAILAALRANPHPDLTLWTIIRARSADLVLTGVGKASAAAAVARTLDPALHKCVVSAGVAGALPGSGLRPGDALCARESIFADEGVDAGPEFISLDDMGFAPAPGLRIPGDSDLLRNFSSRVDRVAPVATVSTCSGTDERALALSRRWSAAAEAMEGAAVGLVAVRLGVPFAEVRVISNTTGNRAAQQWNLDLALRRLGEVLGRD
jgi:futalosine hydrolase